MSSIFHHPQKNGDIYVYSQESYWDKEKKSPRNKRTLLGKLDPITGEIIPTRKKDKSNKHVTQNIDPTLIKSQVAGPSILLDKIMTDIGLKDILTKCFPELFPEIITIIYFIAQKGLALSHIDFWSLNHIHPLIKPYSSQRISELLLEITEGQRQTFFSQWVQKQIEDDYICYDITSISSYAKNNEYTQKGYNRDCENLEQINLGILFGQKSELPIYYRRMQGSINDVSTLKTTVNSLKLIGSKKIHFLMDRGFYSEENISELLENKFDFTITVPTSRIWIKKYLDIHYNSIESLDKYIQINNNDSTYAVTETILWGQKQAPLYLHIYFNSIKAAEEFNSFNNKILNYQSELVSGQTIKEHQKFYEKFFFITEKTKNGRTIKLNNEEIAKSRKKYIGFFCILSSVIEDKTKALEIYRAKDIVEKSFDDLKNLLDSKRLRVHTSFAMDSRIFLQYLALTCICRIRTICKKDEILRNFTVREIMEYLEPIVKHINSNTYYTLFPELDKVQKHIIDVFKLKLEPETC
jgi:transposase